MLKDILNLFKVGLQEIVTFFISFTISISVIFVILMLIYGLYELKAYFLGV